MSRDGLSSGRFRTGRAAKGVTLCLCCKGELLYLSEEIDLHMRGGQLPAVSSRTCALAGRTSNLADEFDEGIQVQC